ncbi:MAG: hypothetical protein K2O14_08860 [Oscillospiraceae bacterium]|nr:hypothetical protein [Oscillospiraceae bacterium]
MGKRKKAVIILLSCLFAVIIAAAVFAVWVSDSIKAEEFCQSVDIWGWEGQVSYSMLSRQLRDIISEEEFNDASRDDTSPMARLRMYQKLDNLVPDNRPKDKFDGSTSWYKAYYFETIEDEPLRYFIDFNIDVTCTLGKIKVHNFTCYIESVEL